LVPGEFGPASKVVVELFAAFVLATFVAVLVVAAFAVCALDAEAAVAAFEAACVVVATFEALETVEVAGLAVFDAFITSFCAIANWHTQDERVIAANRKIFDFITFDFRLLED